MGKRKTTGLNEITRSGIYRTIYIYIYLRYMRGYWKSDRFVPIILGNRNIIIVFTIVRMR